MWVDFHWHARGKKESHKDTVAHSLAIAEAASLDALGAMCNTEEPLLDQESCESYLGLAPKYSPVKFFVHVGLTKNVEQVKRAVDATRKNPKIIGIKKFLAHSTNNMGITDPCDQYAVGKTLVEEGYDGVLVCHLEDEKLINNQLYDPESPMTWSTRCRPEDAEISSFIKIVRMYEELGFKGRLHVAHVSTNFVVDVINGYAGPLKLSCGVTPHHVFFNNERMNGPHGVYFKCNPPLRPETTRAGLEMRLLYGKIPIIESDHAPHTMNDKHPPSGALPASGLANGTAWPYVILALRKRGMSDKQLADACFYNPVKLYKLENLVERSSRPVDYTRLEELQGFYPFDPFASLKRSS